MKTRRLVAAVTAAVVVATLSSASAFADSRHQDETAPQLSAPMQPSDAAQSRRRLVSSRGDSRAPQLMAVWLERQAMRAGEHNTVFVQAEDDRSGVALISGVFLSPAKHARIGFACRLGNNGVWECDVAPPACLDCGSWQLEQVLLQDKANNLITERFENPIVGLVRLDISGDACDAAQPELTAIALDQTIVSNVEASAITVIGTLSDNLCGVSSAAGQAVGPDDAGLQPRIYFSFSPGSDPNTWVGRIPIPRLAAKGVWTISWIQLLDKALNLATYSQSDPVLTGVTFRVQ